MTIKKRRAFTVVELVAVLGLIGLVSAMVVVLVVNLFNIQDASNEQYLVADDLYKVDDVANDYVSFVSLNNDEVRFQYFESTSTSISFKYETYTYSLSYINSSLVISNDYDGEKVYFQKTRSEKLNKVTDCIFTYDDSLSLLNLKVKVNGKDNHFNYVLRAAQ